MGKRKQNEVQCLTVYPINDLIFKDHMNKTINSSKIIMECFLEHSVLEKKADVDNIQHLHHKYTGIWPIKDFFIELF